MKTILLTLACIAGLLYFILGVQQQSSDLNALEIGPRERYMNMLLADPITGKIPKNSRALELEFAHRFKKDKKQYSESLLNEQGWMFAGPNNVGGRTRGFAIDIRNENIMIAGAVSGGIFKSTDQGLSWKKTLRNDQLQSVTSIIQDRRAGKESRWYAGTGEFHGNSSDLNGDGIYASTDYGESWELLVGSRTKTPQSWDGAFEYVYSLAMDYSNTQQDELYVATALGGIHRSTDGGKS
ncbi:MAG: WD40/YVTN/BNR-like repeat-containing protein, partial [bacterium]